MISDSASGYVSSVHRILQMINNGIEINKTRILNKDIGRVLPLKSVFSSLKANFLVDLGDREATSGALNENKGTENSSLVEGEVRNINPINQSCANALIKSPPMNLKYIPQPPNQPS